MVNFSPNHKKVLDELLLSLPGVRAGKMFGYPAYYVGKKLCACLYEDGVGVKLPEPSAARLLESDPAVTRFTPLGRRPMREWIQITLAATGGYRAYLPVFTEAVQYAADLAASTL